MDKIYRILYIKGVCSCIVSFSFLAIYIAGLYPGLIFPLDYRRIGLCLCIFIAPYMRGVHVFVFPLCKVKGKVGVKVK
jgi:hypothetical protein